MKRTIKNLFPAPTDSRTGGARLGARMLPAPTHLRRLFVALMALLTMTAQTARAGENLTLQVDDTIAEGQPGHYYVNMSSSETWSYLTLSDAQVTTFKVYDDGGKDGVTLNKQRILEITAPTDYVLQVSGKIWTHINNSLTVVDYGGNPEVLLINQLCSPSNGEEKDIPTVNTSVGNKMKIIFDTRGNQQQYSGLDLTVNLIPTSTEYNITVNSVTPSGSGSVTVNPTSRKATVCKLVTLTANPSSGYALQDISVTRTDNNEVVPTTGGWYTNNTATFNMPPSNVTVNSTFVQASTAGGGLYINMPRTGSKPVTIPSGVQSFKVYDDGGKDNPFGSSPNGNLVLTAPAGCKLQLAGKIAIGSNDDYSLDVYNNSEASGQTLISGARSRIAGEWTAIPTVASTGESMTIHFHSYTKTTDYSGLDLTVSVINPNEEHNITVNQPTSGGSYSAPAKAKYGNEVTLSPNLTNGYVLKELTIKDVNDDDVAFEGGWYTGSTVKFNMPPSVVTAKPVLTNDLTYNSLYVNMPTTGSKKVTVPDGVTSFKVYDDGGKDGKCSYNCDGTLVLTAPEGKGLLLEGGYDLSINSSTNFVVYDVEAATEGQELLGPVSGSGSFNNVASTARSMTIYLKNTSSFNGGLDLTVTVLDFTTQYDITINNPDTGPSITANPTSAHITQDVTLTSNIVENSKLVALTVKDGSKQDVELSNDLLWYSGKTTATFDMPGSTVTVTPTFMNASSAEEGLYIKMPISSKITADLPTGVESFNVINDVGDHNSSDLVLTAPEGYVLQLEGKIIGDDYHDHLQIYDGLQNNTPQTEILDIRPIATNAWRNIPTVTSTGRNMYIDYYSSYSTSDIELKVTILSANTPHTITVNSSNPEAGGTLTSDKETADYQEVVTLSPSLTDGYVIKDLSIVDEGNNPVAFEGGWYTGNTVTFKMATTAVTVSPVLTNDLTSNGGLYINLPRTGTKTATIPANVKSFKVYDDGGSTGNYSDLCSGKLVLEAPEGYRLQLAGQSQYVTSTHSGSDDFLIVYDNKEASGTELVSKVYYSGSIGANKLSSDRYMTIYFKSDGDYYNAAGIDLGITVKKPLSSTDITVAPIDDQTWTGSEIKPTVTIKDGETDITNQCDITFSNNTNVGTATVTITAKDESNYYGSISTTFNIVRVLFAANTSNLWMTWCDKDEYVKPVGVTVYSVSGVGTDKVTLSEDVSTAQVGEETVSIIPAYTPVLIHRTAAGTGAVTAAFASAGTGTAGIQTAQGTQGCTFYGTTTAQSPIPADNYSDGLTYVLYGDKFIRTNSSYGIAANRCWLVIANPAGARLNILLDETTGLSEALRVEREATDAWYSLDGRRLQGKPSAKGVYINKGKKTVVK